MTQIDPPMDAHLEHVVDGLVNSTHGAVRRHELREIVHECYAELAANAKVTTFLPVLTGRYALQQVRALQQARGDITKDLPEVLMIDEHNAGRSQTAAALARFYAPGRLSVNSAGVVPASGVNEVVVDELLEVGVALTDFPKRVTSAMVTAADHILVLGALSAPVTDAAGGQVVTVDIADPAGADQAEVIAILQRDRRRRAGIPARHRSAAPPAPGGHRPVRCGRVGRLTATPGRGRRSRSRARRIPGSPSRATRCSASRWPGRLGWCRGRHWRGWWRPSSCATRQSRRVPR